MVVFRVDGNSTLGMGHLMRCLCIAMELERKGVKCLFVVSNNTDINLIHDNNIEAISMGNGEEICGDTFFSIISRYNKISYIIIDSYKVQKKDFLNAKKIAKVCYIDDLNIFEYDIDMVINYNVEAQSIMYTEAVGCKLLGVDYFPLREDIKKYKKKQLKNNVTDVLITTGSTDPYELCGKILHILQMYSYIHFTILIGKYFSEEYIRKLEQLRDNNNNINLISWGCDVGKLYMESDVIVAPGGTMLYEALSVGCTCLSFWFVDNQENECECLKQYGLAPSIGDIRKESAEIDDRIKEEFASIILMENRERFFTNSNKTFDGNGAKRIAEKIITCGSILV